ncbi:hypothetical protein GGF31_008000 [Allomyces arbusculus]|nr:hypothetical protein GGF31_008000 [Allomyces arbusculus]
MATAPPPTSSSTTTRPAAASAFSDHRGHAALSPVTPLIRHVPVPPNLPPLSPDHDEAVSLGPPASAPTPLVTSLRTPVVPPATPLPDSPAMGLALLSLVADQLLAAEFPADDRRSQGQQQGPGTWLPPGSPRVPRGSLLGRPLLAAAAAPRARVPSVTTAPAVTLPYAAPGAAKSPYLDHAAPPMFASPRPAHAALLSHSATASPRANYASPRPSHAPLLTTRSVSASRKRASSPTLPLAHGPVTQSPAPAHAALRVHDEEELDDTPRKRTRTPAPPEDEEGVPPPRTRSASGSSITGVGGGVHAGVWVAPASAPAVPPVPPHHHHHHHHHHSGESMDADPKPDPDAHSGGSSGDDPSSSDRNGAPTAMFPCETCGRSFTRKHDLRRHHMVIHEQARPFRCPNRIMCQFQTNRRDQLLRHLKNRIHCLEYVLLHEHVLAPGMEETFGARWRELVMPKLPAGVHTSPVVPHAARVGAVAASPAMSAAPSPSVAPANGGGGAPLLRAPTAVPPPAPLLRAAPPPPAPGVLLPAPAAPPSPPPPPPPFPTAPPATGAAVRLPPLQPPSLHHTHMHHHHHHHHLHVLHPANGTAPPARAPSQGAYGGAGDAGPLPSIRALHLAGPTVAPPRGVPPPPIPMPGMVARQPPMPPRSASASRSSADDASSLSSASGSGGSGGGAGA